MQPSGSPDPQGSLVLAAEVVTDAAARAASFPRGFVCASWFISDVPQHPSAAPAAGAAAAAPATSSATHTPPPLLLSAPGCVPTPCPPSAGGLAAEAAAAAAADEVYHSGFSLQPRHQPRGAKKALLLGRRKAARGPAGTGGETDEVLYPYPLEQAHEPRRAALALERLRRLYADAAADAEDAVRCRRRHWRRPSQRRPTPAADAATAAVALAAAAGDRCSPVRFPAVIEGGGSGSGGGGGGRAGSALVQAAAAVACDEHAACLHSLTWKGSTGEVEARAAAEAAMRDTVASVVDGGGGSGDADTAGLRRMVCAHVAYHSSRSAAAAVATDRERFVCSSRRALRGRVCEAAFREARVAAGWGVAQAPSQVLAELRATHWRLGGDDGEGSEAQPPPAPAAAAAAPLHQALRRLCCLVTRAQRAAFEDDTTATHAAYLSLAHSRLQARLRLRRQRKLERLEGPVRTQLDEARRREDDEARRSTDDASSVNSLFPSRGKGGPGGPPLHPHHAPPVRRRRSSTRRASIARGGGGAGGGGGGNGLRGRRRRLHSRSMDGGANGDDAAPASALLARELADLESNAHGELDCSSDSAAEALREHAEDLASHAPPQAPPLRSAEAALAGDGAGGARWGVLAADEAVRRLTRMLAWERERCAPRRRSSGMPCAVFVPEDGGGGGGGGPLCADTLELHRRTALGRRHRAAMRQRRRPPPEALLLPRRPQQAPAASARRPHTAGARKLFAEEEGGLVGCVLRGGDGDGGGGATEPSAAAALPRMRRRSFRGAAATKAESVSAALYGGSGAGRQAPGVSAAVEEERRMREHHFPGSTRGAGFRCGGGGPVVRAHGFLEARLNEPFEKNHAAQAAYQTRVDELQAMDEAGWEAAAASSSEDDGGGGGGGGIEFVTRAETFARRLAACVGEPCSHLSRPLLEFVQPCRSAAYLPDVDRFCRMFGPLNLSLHHFACFARMRSFLPWHSVEMADVLLSQDGTPEGAYVTYPYGSSVGDDAASEGCRLGVSFVARVWRRVAQSATQPPPPPPAPAKSVFLPGGAGSRHDEANMLAELRTEGRNSWFLTEADRAAREVARQRHPPVFYATAEASGGEKAGDGANEAAVAAVLPHRSDPAGLTEERAAHPERFVEEESVVVRGYLERSAADGVVSFSHGEFVSATLFETVAMHAHILAHPMGEAYHDTPWLARGLGDGLSPLHRAALVNSPALVRRMVAQGQHCLFRPYRLYRYLPGLRRHATNTSLAGRPLPAPLSGWSGEGDGDGDGSGGRGAVTRPPASPRTPMLFSVLRGGAAGAAAAMRTTADAAAAVAAAAEEAEARAAGTAETLAVHGYPRRREDAAAAVAAAAAEDPDAATEDAEPVVVEALSRAEVRAALLEVQEEGTGAAVFRDEYLLFLVWQLGEANGRALLGFCREASVASVGGRTPSPLDERGGSSTPAASSSTATPAVRKATPAECLAAHPLADALCAAFLDLVSRGGRGLLSQPAVNKRVAALHAAVHTEACGGDSEAVVCTLLRDARCDPNRVDADGAAPLHTAVARQQEGTVLALLRHGADQRCGTAVMPLLVALLPPPLCHPRLSLVRLLAATCPDKRRVLPLGLGLCEARVRVLDAASETADVSALFRAAQQAILDVLSAAGDSCSVAPVLQQRC